MRKPSATEEALDRIREIRKSPESFDLKRDLAPYLRNKSNHVIAAAAAVVMQVEYARLSEELAAAFLELFPKAAARDPGCKALTAIVEAMVTKGDAADEPYLRGVRHVQKEGSFGPPVDVASRLRGLCVRGLVRMKHPEGLYLAVETLVDKETPARVGAVQALGDAGTREAELLLRLKVLEGDHEGDVLSACFAELLQMAPSRSFEFVARRLRQGADSEAEAAALALGEARSPQALELLQEAWGTRKDPQVRRTILVSIAMLRSADAVEYLLTRLKQDAPAAALEVLDALALYQHDDAVSARVREIVEARKLPARGF